MQTFDFKDNINFKLAIMGFLHDLGYFNDEASDIKEAHEDMRDFSYEPIPQVLEFYKNLPLSQEILDKVTVFQPDGGDLTYEYLMNNWDGEDEQFDVQSLQGIELLRNLEIYDPIALVSRTVDITPLLQCPNLKQACFDFIANTEANQKVRTLLETKGVEII